MKSWRTRIGIDAEARVPSLDINSQRKSEVHIKNIRCPVIQQKIGTIDSTYMAYSLITPIKLSHLICQWLPPVARWFHPYPKLIPPPHICEHHLNAFLFRH